MTIAHPTTDGRDSLAHFFFAGAHRPTLKWHHYFEIYERHFERFRGRAPVILEIGVGQGGSLQMWREYLGPEAVVIGVDCNEACRTLDGPGIHIEIGNQADRGFWKRLRQKYPRIDIVVDDGGHRPEQQTITFEELYFHLSPDGVYLCEDLHTNYWRRYGGGLGAPGTFIEYSKRLIDHLTLWHSEDQRLNPITEFTRATWSMHYYNSVLVIEKRRNPRPQQTCTGKSDSGE